MSLKIEFNTIEDIKEFRTNVQVLKLQLLQFQGRTVNELARNITLRRIHDRMRAANFSQKIINGTTVSSVELSGTKKVKIHFRSEFFADTGFDVAVAREEGTEDHFIEPLALSSPFIDEPKALNFDGNKFSMGHFVDGLLALFIVADSVAQTAASFADEYRRRLIEFYRSRLGGIVVNAS